MRKTDQQFKKIGLLTMGILGLALGYSLAKMESKGEPSSPGRHPSSFSQVSGKHQRLLETEILLPQGLPGKDDQDLVLKGRIRGLEPLAGEVHYQWILPEGVTVVAGEVKDSFVGLPDPHKFVDLEITLQGLSLEGENKTVILQAYTDIQGVKIGNSTVFSTKMEETHFAGQSLQKLETESAPRPLPSHIQQ